MADLDLSALCDKRFTSNQGAASHLIFAFFATPAAICR
jgi:hypothetical protein